MFSLTSLWPLFFWGNIFQGNEYKIPQVTNQVCYNPTPWPSMNHSFATGVCAGDITCTLVWAAVSWDPVAAREVTVTTANSFFFGDHWM